MATSKLVPTMLSTVNPHTISKYGYVIRNHCVTQILKTRYYKLKHQDIFFPTVSISFESKSKLSLRHSNGCITCLYVCTLFTSAFWMSSCVWFQLWLPRQASASAHTSAPCCTIVACILISTQGIPSTFWLLQWWPSMFSPQFSLASSDSSIPVPTYFLWNDISCLVT